MRWEPDRDDGGPELMDVVFRDLGRVALWAFWILAVVLLVCL